LPRRFVGHAGCVQADADAPDGGIGELPKGEGLGNQLLHRRQAEIGVAKRMRPARFMTGDEHVGLAAV
jgi:hypothetical protein